MPGSFEIFEEAEIATDDFSSCAFLAADLLYLAADMMLHPDAGARNFAGRVGRAVQR